MLHTLKNLARYVLVKALHFVVKGNGVLFTKIPKKQWVRKEGELLGGKYVRPVYFPNGIEEKYLGTMESQAITAKDFWTCVSNSLCRIVQIILQYLITIDEELRKGLDELGFIDEKGNVNISQRALAVMSGTIPGRGNSMYKVAETARTRGLVSEKFCPTLPGMTEWEYFKLPPGTEAQALKFLKLVDLFHEDLIGNATPELFTQGALQAAVSSPYNISNGVVRAPSYYNYNHAIAWYGLAPKLYKLVCDSYPEFLKKFAADYIMQRPKIIYVQKKTLDLNYPLIQYAGGIYYLAKAGRWAGKYIGFEFGDNYKGHFGEYKDLKRVIIEKLPSNMARWDDGSIVKEAYISDMSTTGKNPEYDSLARLANENINS